MKKKPAKKFGQRYPWASWFANGPVTLRQGTHFSCTGYVMVQMARQWAARNGYRLETSITHDKVTIVPTMLSSPKRTAARRRV